MFGTGVFEIILLWWGISYFYMFSRKKDETEYIQLNEDQFDQLRYTLVANDIIPERLCINSNLNDNNLIPPRYDDQSRPENPPPFINSSSNNQTHENTIKEDSFDNDAPIVQATPQSMEIVF